MFDLEFEIKDALSKHNKPISWYEIRETIVKSLDPYGQINISSGSLHYHLKRLIENGEVKKLSLGEELYYSLEQ